MFTKPELESLQRLCHGEIAKLNDVGGPYRSDTHTLGELQALIKRCEEEKELINKRVSAMAIASVIEDVQTDGTSSEAPDWVKDADALIHQMVYEEGNKLDTARELRISLEQQVDILVAKLRSLRDVEQIQSENQRLRLELTAVGKETSEEHITQLKKMLTVAKEETEVYRRQVDALKTALRAERVERHYEEERPKTALLGAANGTTALLSDGTPAPPAWEHCRMCNKPIPEFGKIFCDDKCRTDWDSKAQP